MNQNALKNIISFYNLNFDILSYDANGQKMYIEVKTTPGEENTSFFISANELEKSRLYADSYYLYRVDLKEK